MADMVAAALRGERAVATQIDQRLVALHRNLFVESNPIPVKWAMARMGLMGGTIRLPLTELSPEYHAVVSESLFGMNGNIRSLVISSTDTAGLLIDTLYLDDGTGVPEPGTLGLLGGAVTLLGVLVRRQRFSAERSRS